MTLPPTPLGSRPEQAYPRRMAQRFTPLERPSPFRRMAAAMWRSPEDPTIYGTVDIDATKLRRFLDEQRRRHGAKITFTHAVARALGVVYGRHPDLNAKVRLWGKLERRTTVDLFVTVSSDSGKDLSGARIDSADKKTIAQIAAELRTKASQVRDGSDKGYEQSRQLFFKLPWWIARAAIDASDLITNELHLDFPSLGMPVDPFGTAIVTNVGMFGVDTAFAAFLPISRCPALILVTEVKDRPWVEDGQLVVRPVLRLCGTFDHRIIDGYAAGVLSREVSELLSDPEKMESGE